MLTLPPSLLTLFNKVCPRSFRFLSPLHFNVEINNCNINATQTDKVSVAAFENSVEAPGHSGSITYHKSSNSFSVFPIWYK